MERRGDKGKGKATAPSGRLEEDRPRDSGSTQPGTQQPEKRNPLKKIFKSLLHKPKSTPTPTPKDTLEEYIKVPQVQDVWRGEVLQAIRDAANKGAFEPGSDLNKLAQKIRAGHQLFSTSRGLDLVSVSPWAGESPWAGQGGLLPLKGGEFLANYQKTQPRTRGGSIYRFQIIRKGFIKDERYYGSTFTEGTEQLPFRLTELGDEKSGEYRKLFDEAVAKLRPQQKASGSPSEPHAGTSPSQQREGFPQHHDGPQHEVSPSSDPLPISSEQTERQHSQSQHLPLKARRPLPQLPLAPPPTLEEFKMMVETENEKRESPLPAPQSVEAWDGKAHIGSTFNMPRDRLGLHLGEAHYTYLEPHERESVTVDPNGKSISLARATAVAEQQQRSQRRGRLPNPPISR